VIKLAGQPINKNISQFSGYITVNESHGRALFYWFFPAQSQPINNPLLLWLNGGPGCSSIGYGAAVELGPLRVGKNGANLEFNPHSWNKEANLLFVESPIGVGFSYTNTSSDFALIDDEFVAEDTYNFLVNWLNKFPHFKNHDFFISGESYAGHYVPQLAELIYDRNNNRNKYPYINLKGFIVGNPETNDYFDYKGLLEYAWSHSVISDQDYDNAVKSCDFMIENWSTACVNGAQTSRMWGRMKVGPGGYDPCYSKYAEAYFNKIEVQKALHVMSDRVKWTVCNDSVFRTYNYTVFSVLPIYKKLIKGGLKIWMYSGDADGRVPVIGTRYCVEAMGLTIKKPWTSWFYNNQVAGRVVEYQGLTLVTIRGAGHLVPLNKPNEALALIHAYLSNHPLSTRR
ncbi:hypothetical protein MIMGU_mgv1a022493mg, partial [Erythranthe guttata]